MSEEKESRQGRQQAKWYLMQIRSCESIVEKRKSQLGKLQAEAYGLRGISYESEPVQASPDGSGLERYTERLQEIRERIMEAILQREETKERIIEEIQEMTRQQYSEILYKRYVEIKGRRMKPFEVIAVELGYSCDHIKRMHRKALSAFWQQYKENICQQRENIRQHKENIRQTGSSAEK